VPNSHGKSVNGDARLSLKNRAQVPNESRCAQLSKRALSVHSPLTTRERGLSTKNRGSGGGPLLQRPANLEGSKTQKEFFRYRFNKRPPVIQTRPSHIGMAPPFQCVFHHLSKRFPTNGASCSHYLYLKPLTVKSLNFAASVRIKT